MSSEVYPARSTVIESNPVESVGVFASRSPPAATVPITKFSGGSDAIFAVVPINTDNYGTYGKPNAIVRPVRRNEPTEMTLPQANEVNIPASNQSTPKVIVPAKYKKHEIDTFTKELDNKLRHLQKDKKTSSKNVTIVIIFGLNAIFVSYRSGCRLDCVWLVCCIETIDAYSFSVRPFVWLRILIAF